MGRAYHRMKSIKMLISGIAACWYLGLLAGCASWSGDQLKLADCVERPDRSIIVFLADAMDVQRLHELVDAGVLPNIRRVFLDGGVEVRHTLSGMPSVTYPNCSVIVTGLYPGHHGIMGNFWFDRHRAEIHYYMTLDTARNVNNDLQAATIYDILSDRLTVSILAQTHKGVTDSLDLKGTFDWNWILGTYINVDREVGRSFDDVIGIANRVGRWPTVVFSYYPAVDELGHRRGPDSDEYKTALIDVDNTVGNVTAKMAALGLGSSVYYALLADHGMVPACEGQDFAFIKWLRTARKMKVLNSPLRGTSYTDRFANLSKYDAVATVDAGRVAMVHLRGRAGWAHKPGPDEVMAWAMAGPAVHELPAVEMVACRDGKDRARVWSRRGSLTVEREVENSRKRYRIADYTGDPLVLREDPKLAEFAGIMTGESDGRWHDSRAWLIASAPSRYPDLVAQMVEMFDSAHTGDLVVFASEGWLLYPGERAGHGSTLSRDMHATMFFAGPDLPGGTQISPGRLVDFVPTVLGLLGESERLKSFPPRDGVDLSDQLRRAQSK